MSDIVWIGLFALCCGATWALVGVFHRLTPAETRSRS